MVFVLPNLWRVFVMALVVFSSITFILCSDVAPAECDGYSDVRALAFLEVDCSGKKPLVKAKLNPDESVGYAIVYVKAVCTWNQTESTQREITWQSIVQARPKSTSVKNVPSGADCTFAGCYEVAGSGEYLFESKTCVYNRDECNLGEDDCHENATCTNTIGGFECHCLPMFTGDGRNCTEKISEYEEESHMCHNSATICTSTGGVINCECIDAGSEGNGFNCTKTVVTDLSPRTIGISFNCTDIDECSEGTDDCEHNCNNTIGSFECYCRNGYRLNEDGKGCKDIDECEENSHMCSSNAICSNINGDYNCSCFVGYEGDGFNCTIISVDGP